jgi:hypothetical protein
MSKFVHLPQMLSCRNKHPNVVESQILIPKFRAMRLTMCRNCGFSAANRVHCIGWMDGCVAPDLEPSILHVDYKANPRASSHAARLPLTHDMETTSLKASS